MGDPNAIFGVIVVVVTPTVYCAAGQVDVAGLWSQPQPAPRLWRSPKPPRGHGWKTTELPDQHSGGF